MSRAVFDIARYAARALAVLLAMAACDGAMAADVASVRVSASVLGVCKVQQVNEIQFGALDPSQPVDSVATGSVSFMCTRGVEYRLVADHGENFDVAGGVRRMKSNGSGEYLPYALAREEFNGIGEGFRAAVTVALEARVNGSDYRDLPADAYSDVIRLVLEP